MLASARPLQLAPLTLQEGCRTRASSGHVDASRLEEQLSGGVPKPLQSVLMPFQREGVLFGLARSGRVLIADEMGVGKTLQALALACCYQVRSDVMEEDV